MKHSPGPWTIRQPKKAEATTFCFVDAGTENLSVAKILTDDYRGDDKAKSNATLIAAAPDLLEQLKLIVSYVGMRSYDKEVLHNMVIQAQSVIAKVS